MELSSFINPKYIGGDNTTKLHNDFVNASPCRHLALDGFLKDELATNLFENFPDLTSLNVKRKSLNENKAEDYHFERWHPAFAQLQEGIKSKEFANYISEVTGIKGLHTTDDSLGSGVHQGGNGSFVDVHIDVNMNVKKGLWRRINLLIYLNKNWKDGYGGDLELWNKEMTECIVKYPPLFNQAVIFYTDENSPHGYSKINIPEGESRKSFYSYFYTKPEEGVKFRDSQFLSRPEDSAIKKAATKTKEKLKIGAKSLLYKLGLKSLDFQDKNKDKK